MKFFKYDGVIYEVFKKGEKGNPHPTKCPCIVSAKTDEIPFGIQRSVLRGFLATIGTTFTETEFGDVSTHDLVHMVAFTPNPSESTAYVGFQVFDEEFGVGCIDEVFYNKNKAYEWKHNNPDDELIKVTLR